jgi:hypothetical protein
MAITIGGGVSIGGGISFVPYVATDPYWSSTSLLLPGNGSNGANNNTFVDSSTNNLGITRVGSTTQGTFTPFIGNGYYSTYFDGSSYLTVSNNAALAAGTGDFTIEAWVYPTTTTQFQVIGINTLQFFVYNNSLYYNDGPQTSGGTIVLNTWQHVAVSRSGTAVKGFVNGVQVITTSSSVNLTSANNYIGFNGGTQYGQGYISNLRVVKGTALYTSNFTPSTTPLTAISGTSLLTLQDNRFKDNSTNNLALTVNGTPSVQPTSPFAKSSYSVATNGGSMYFDGSSSYLSSTTTAFQHTGDFTYECWVYWNGTVPSDWPMIFDTRPSNTAHSTSICCDLNPTSFRLNFYLGGTSYYWGSTALPANSWVHVAVVRSSGTVKIYQNGVSGTDTASNSNTFSGATGIRIGANIGNMGYWPGYISNFRVTNAAVYTANFTPSTTPLTAIANTSLLLSGTNAAVIDNTMSNNLVTVGDAGISTAQSKWGGSSVYFDGSGDYLTMPPASNLAFGTGDFTVELWYYSTNFTYAKALVDFRPSGGNGAYFTLWVTTSGQPFYYANTANQIIGAATLLNTWNHVAVVRLGTSTKMYINGVVQSTTYTDSNTYLSPTDRPFIGSDSNNLSNPNSNFIGYINDLRITKGVARYTSNFSVPTEAFPIQG